MPVVAGVSEVRGPFSVPGTDGVCGSLAAGQPSYTDSRGEPPCGSRRSSACPQGLDPPPEGRMPQPASACKGDSGGVTCVRTGSWGATVGAIGWSSVCSRCAGGVAVAGHFVCPFQMEAYVTCCPFGGFGMCFGQCLNRYLPGRILQELGIWLILPVVICLSQRLSHACLSVSNLYCETANGSLNQLSFI